MGTTSAYYSKGRTSSNKKVFSGDSEDKEERSTRAIQQYAKSILDTSYKTLNAKGLEAIQRVSPQIYDLVTAGVSLPSASDTGDVSEQVSELNWSVLKTVPKNSKPSQLSKLIRGLSKLNPLARPPSLDPPLDAAADATSDPSSLTDKDSTTADTTATGEEEEKDDDESDIKEAAGHSHFPKIPYEPWAPFSNTHNSRPFERVPCPLQPEPDYPRTYPMSTVTDNWNTDSTIIPEFHYDSLCHFDYQNATQLAQAYTYRSAELPFIVYNVPEVDNVVRKWSDVDYIHQKLGSKNYRTEASKTNHFMYWSNASPNFLRGMNKKWTPPTVSIYILLLLSFIYAH